MRAQAAGRQLRAARAVRRLRDLDVPLETIAEVLRADEPALRDLLRTHRERVASAAVATGWILAELDLVIDGGEALVPATDITSTWRTCRSCASRR